MKLLKSYYFILHVAIYLGYKIMAASGIRFPKLITSYLADYTALPVILTLILVFIRVVQKRENYTFCPWHIALMVVWFSFLMEAVFPRFYPITGDYYDFLAYSLGGISYWLWQKFNLNKQVIA